jgi:predicted nucleic acid-binding protein
MTSCLNAIQIGKMAYLLDTNVVSELRKGPRCNPGVANWFATVDDEDLFISVLVIGEIERGIGRLRLRDGAAAGKLESWLTNIVETYEDRILPITLAISRIWGGYGIQNTLPTIDGLLAATAQYRGLTLVTRNVRDVADTGVRCLNPFDDCARDR